MNVQTIPRKDTVIKRAFIPKLDALVFADYKQIELRLLAYYMAMLGDTSMADVIKSGRDLHDESARGALRLPEGSLTDDQRQVGKTLNFSIVYGGGRPTIKKQLDLSWNEAGQILDNYHRRWPGIQILQNTIQQVIARRERPMEPGYITTLWGRHLRPEDDHKALNALVQGCAADLMRSSIVRVHDHLTAFELQSHIVSNVHDELIIDAVLPEVPRVTDVLPELMDYDLVSEVVPIEIDIEWSTTSWADKAPYTEEARIGLRS